MSGADALFLDFDGTLVEIAERPEAVVVAPGLPETLTRLAARLDGALALVSGRPIAFLDERLAPARLDAAGLHGTERRVGGALHPCRPEDHPDLRAGVEALRAAAADAAGLLVEDKGCSVALHWRLAPRREEEALALAEGLAARLGPAWRLQRGKAVAEILPASSSKGAILGTFLAEAPYRGRRPIVIGDDLTDEAAFAAALARGGAAVRVGEGETAAPYRLAAPADLRAALAAWAQAGAIDLAGLPRA